MAPEKNKVNQILHFSKYQTRKIADQIIGTREHTFSLVLGI